MRTIRPTSHLGHTRARQFPLHKSCQHACCLMLTSAPTLCALCGHAGPHDCAHRVVPCLYETECRWRGPRKDRAAHLESCGAAELLCHFVEPATGETCGVHASRHGLAAHQLSCPFRPVRCRTCSLLFTSRTLPAHLQTCLLVVDTCISCGARVRRALSAAHRCSPTEPDARLSFPELDASLSALALRAAAVSATKLQTPVVEPAPIRIGPVRESPLDHAAELLRVALSQARGELAGADAAAILAHENQLDAARAAALRAYEAAVDRDAEYASLEELLAARNELSRLQAGAHTRAFAASAASAECVDCVSRDNCRATKMDLEALRDELAACHKESALAGRSQSRSAADAVGSEQAVLQALEVPLAALEAEVTRASARIGLVL